MISLSSKDYKNILDTIDIVYSVSDRNAMLDAFCGQLRKAIGIYSAIFVPADPQTGNFCFHGYRVYNNSEGALLTYLAHYAPQDPFVSSGWFRDHPNQVIRNTDLMSDLVETEFAQDFLLPVANVFHVLASTLQVQGDRVGILGIHRQRRDRAFGAREIAILNRLLPHLARVLQRAALLAEESFFTEMGVVMTDSRGKPCFMNPVAKSALRGAEVASLPDPGSGTSAAFFRRGRRSYRVRTVPAVGRNSGRFILLEPYPAMPRLAGGLSRFVLSDREKAVAALVAQGLSNRDVAEQLFISELTVKDHLKRIFGKLEVRRRSELAACILGIAPRDSGRPSDPA